MSTTVCLFAVISEVFFHVKFNVFGFKELLSCCLCPLIKLIFTAALVLAAVVKNSLTELFSSLCQLRRDHGHVPGSDLP